MGGNGGGQSSSPTQQETDGENLGNVELGGDGVTIIAEMEGVVGEERLAFREEQVQCVRKKRGKQVLAASALFGEVVAGQRRQTLKENQDVGRITEIAVFKSTKRTK